jgi:hypothetical protein
MQANTILIPARRELQDEFAGKWPDNVLFGYIADGLAEMLRLRPDLLLSNDGDMQPGGMDGGGLGGSYVRIRRGRLEIWDSGLSAWVAVSMENGTFVPLLPDDQTETALSPDGVTLDGETEIAINDASMVAPLVQYVIYRGKMQFAEGVEAQNAATTHHQAYRSRLGVDRRA